MTLVEIISSLGRSWEPTNEQPDERVIYAAKPWVPESAAIVVPAPEDNSLPDVARSQNLAYFLEVSLAMEVLEDMMTLSAEQGCLRVIAYAINDA
jgi:hypothetical protein